MNDSDITEVKIKKKKPKVEQVTETAETPKSKKIKRESPEEEDPIEPKSKKHKLEKVKSEDDNIVTESKKNIKDNIKLESKTEVKHEAIMDPKTENEDIKDSKVPWEVLISRCQPIALPIATKKFCKKIFKLIIKANKRKELRKGVREVQKFIRKGEKGIVILAGDTSPIDVISHLPIVCEDNSIPYCYVPSKEELGSICSTNRQTCCMLIKNNPEYSKMYDDVYSEIKLMPLPI